MDQESCRISLGFSPKHPMLLVMGGSQGASGINRLFLKTLPLLALKIPNLQILHLTGEAGLSEALEIYQRYSLKFQVKPFLTEMDLALGAANATVSRSGGSSLAEISAASLPSLLIPYPHAADDHQRHNANAFARAGAAFSLGVSESSPDKLAVMLVSLLDNEVLRLDMQNALRKWFKPNAAHQISEIISACLYKSKEFSLGVTDPDSLESNASTRAGNPHITETT